MQTTTVNLGERSYPIYVGRNLLEKPEIFRPFILGERAVVISNETIAPLYAKTLCDSISEFVRTDLFCLPDGEIHKNIATVGHIFDRLLSIPCDRKTTILALGGGVVGDIAGFAAACYQRGVPYIHVPTTLLAQVDSSIGGKTGVNHPAGKNMIGAIYQPKCVVADINTLQSLPQRELQAGLAEVIKYGLIRDPEFFTWMEQNIDALLAHDLAALTYAIERSCINKAQVVEQDERESGVRALLNFGHTFGHAIENKLGYKDWLHGEAVAAGMVIAAQFSKRLNLIDEEQYLRVEETIGKFGLPIRPPSDMTEDEFLDAMAVDKKVDAGKIRFIVLEKIGKAFVIDDYPLSVLKQTLAAFRQPSTDA